MKLNKKGFTMIELLAAIAIISILSGVAVTAVTKYQEKARKESYEAMEKSAYVAAQNYIQKTGFVVPSDGTTRKIDIETLVDGGDLDKLHDPRVKGSYCHSGSTVVVSKEKGTGTKLDKYTYLVTIKCRNYTSSHYEKDPSTGASVKKEGVYFYS